MKTLYTNTNQPGVYEVCPGVYAKPVHTTEVAKHIKKGWSKTYHGIRKEEAGRQQGTGSLTVREMAEKAGLKTHDEDGRPVHHKRLEKQLKAIDNEKAGAG